MSSLRAVSLLVSPSHSRTLFLTRLALFPASPADPSPKDWLSLTSLTSLPTATTTPTPSSTTPSPREPPLESHLCYSCLTTLVSPAGAAGGGAPPPRKEGNEPARLPAWTMGNLVRERRKEVGEMLVGEGWLLSEADEND